MNRTSELATTNIRIISIPVRELLLLLLFIYCYGALIKLTISLLQFYPFTPKCNYMRIYLLASHRLRTKARLEVFRESGIGVLRFFNIVGVGIRGASRGTARTTAVTFKQISYRFFCIS